MFALIILAIIILIVIVAHAGAGNTNSVNHNTPAAKTIRCPNCGSQAMVKGDQWECGWCGDYGPLR